ncbi:MAG: hypothetical protein KDB61_01165, partial [Planctomycetes bacterium]|nr:hypothetical protein [Planctomycetota bacterium]
TVSLSGDGGATWTVVDTMGPATADSNGGWIQHAVFLNAIMTPTSNMQLRWVASDLGSGSIVEAALDDVEGTNLGPSAGFIGTRYCSPALPNSSMFPSFINAYGSENAALNNVTLSATLMAYNQFGIFLNGTAQGSVVPAGSQGNLCVSGALGRYNRMGEIFYTGQTGSGSLTLDLTNTPTNSGTVSILSGQTWTFQAWFRDNNPGSTSNFSDAVSVTFY